MSAFKPFLSTHPLSDGTELDRYISLWDVTTGEYIEMGGIKRSYLI